VRHDLDPAIVPDPDPVLIHAPVNNLYDANVLLDQNINTNSKLVGTSIAIQNVRSLNVSTKNDISTQKILAICKLGTDIIFLSDLRLNSSKQVSAVHDLDKKIFLKGYKFYHNSCSSLRGVGILLSKKYIDSDFSILQVVRDVSCNILCLHVEIKGQQIILCSVYGPNKDTDLDFYQDLINILRPFDCPLILGGDWNATMDISDANVNLDIVNMQNVPSVRRSLKILEMCQDFNLIEPFRTKNPNKREYTFIPSGLNDVNRSRLDFFLMSSVLYNQETLTTVPHNLTSTFLTTNRWQWC